MRSLLLIINLIISISLTAVSQNKTQYPIPAESDFRIESKNNTVFIIYESTWSFPFRSSYNEAGAYNRSFSLKNECFIRILIKNKENPPHILLLPGYDGRLPEINEVKYYSNSSGKVKSLKSDLNKKDIFTINEKGCFLNLLTSLPDEVNIVDISFNYLKRSKIVIQQDIIPGVSYKSLTCKVEIPAIYTYQIDYNREYIKMNPGELYDGPVIGYNIDKMTLREGSAAFFSKALIDDLQKDFNKLGEESGKPNLYLIERKEVKCKIQPYIFRSVGMIEYEGLKNTFILLKLDEINEINPNPKTGASEFW